MKVILTPRALMIVAANMIECPWERARALFNLGVKGGTTRKSVDWYLSNGTFA